MSRHPDRGMQYAGGQYVYYRTLPDYYPALAATEDVQFKAYMKEVTNLEAISAQFGAMADGELAKEMALINEKFGAGVTGNYEDKGFAKRLITAINECMGMKEIFERNLALIKESSGGQKNVMSFFPTYFQHVWNEHAETIYNEATANFVGADQVTLDTAFADAVNAKLPDLVKEALLIMMEDAKVETGIHKDREKYQQAYAEMADALRKGQAGSNEFIQAFINNYKLNQIADAIKDAAVDTSQIQSIVGKNKKAPVNIQAQVAQRAGIAMEDVLTYMQNIVFEGLANVTGSETIKVSGKAFATGGTKMKSDVTTVLDIPFDALEDWLNSNDFGNRQKNVEAALKLEEKLKEFNDGFITYTNAKNYTLNSNFENGGEGRMAGFSAGSAISLETFSSIMSTMGVAADQIIRSCMQLIPGAIGDDQMEQAKIMMARMIATALFDDFNTIGVVETSGAKSIHLLDLNGVLLPLSFYLHLLSKAFADVAALDVAKGLVEVEITTPAKVMYDHPAPYGESEIYWSTQATAARKGINVSWHFLSSFKSIMSQFM